MNQGGKGDKPRPFSVDRQVYESNWDQIFQKKKPEEDVPVLENEEMWTQRVLDEEEQVWKEWFEKIENENENKYRK